MDAPHPRVVVAVNPPLLAEALARVLQRQHGDSSADQAVQVITLDREPQADGDYVLRLPDGTGEPAVLLAPDGRATSLVLHGVTDVTDLVGDLLRRG